MKVIISKLKRAFGQHRLTILAISICILLSVSITVYALTYLWSGSVGATITTEVENIKVYDELGNEVTSITFGNLNPGSTIGVTLIIKNVSPNATITITWDSTLSSVTNKITDRWTYGYYAYDLHVTLDPGESITTTYRISVASDCPLQSYSWTLYIVPG